MILRFDDCELDTELFQLRRGAHVLKIEPKAFDLLRFLVCHRDRVVTREEILDQVWEGRAVSDAAISTCVKSLRQALGDDGNTQRLVQTVRGRGFRFVGEVSEEVPNGETVAAVTAVTAVKESANGPDSLEPSQELAGSDPLLEAARGRPAHQERPVLAVLPFDNLSGELETYFADGLAEDLINNLSRFRELLVLARSTTFQFRDRALNLRDFCAELAVDYVVEGSVRRAGGRIRITTKLIDPHRQVHLCAETFDREIEDLFSVQDEVARTIAANLGVQIQDEALQRSLRKSRAELDAYDCTLRARRFTRVLTPEAHLEARALLEQAVQLDPSSADAFALLGNVYLAEHRMGLNPKPGSVERALAAAQKAVQLDPQNAYARCWLGVVHFFRGENARFEEEAERALKLNPNDPEILADIGHFLAFMGQYQRGMELSARAQRLNPLHPGWYVFAMARLHYHQGEYEAMLADVQRIDLGHFYWTHLLRAAALGQLGRPEAAEALAEIFRLKPDFSAHQELRRWNAAPDDLAHLVEGLEKAGLRQVDALPDSAE